MTRAITNRNGQRRTRTTEDNSRSIILFTNNPTAGMSGASSLRLPGSTAVSNRASPSISRKREPNAFVEDETRNVSIAEFVNSTARGGMAPSVEKLRWANVRNVRSRGLLNMRSDHLQTLTFLRRSVMPARFQPLEAGEGATLRHASGNPSVVTAHGSVDKAEPLIEAPVNTLEGNGPGYRVTTVSTMNIRSAKHCLRALLDYFWVRRMPVILTTTLLAGGKQTRTPILSPRLIQLLVLLLFLFPALSRARSVSQEKEREPLGSLTRVGEVFVNDSPAPAEITIFSGDRVRTGDSGSATFNMSGKGSLKISPRSQVLFSGKYEYTAELEAGVVAMNSING